MSKYLLLILLFISGLCTTLEAEKVQSERHNKKQTENIITAEAALAKLMRGNRRFSAHHMQHPDETRQRQLKLAKEGQHPFAIVLSCSDSRVPPEIIFDEGLGDLFVIRVAGNIVDDAVIGSIEYAAEHLDVKLLLVLGHENCGAVQAAIENKGEAHINSLVQAIRPAMKRIGEAATPNGKDENAAKYAVQVVRANVEYTVELLKTSQPVLASLREQHKLKIVGGYYHLANGRVTLLP